jgi:hypothetical protein
MLEEEAGRGSWNRPGHQIPEHPAIVTHLFNAGATRVVNPESSERQFHPVFKKIQENRDQRAGVQGHVEGLTPIGPPKQPGKKYQVGRAADRKKLRQALDDGEDDCLVKEQ